jgi:hypothetical protein
VADEAADPKEVQAWRQGWMPCTLGSRGGSYVQSRTSECWPTLTARSSTPEKVQPSTSVTEPDTLDKTGRPATMSSLVRAVR